MCAPACAIAVDAAQVSPLPAQLDGLEVVGPRVAPEPKRPPRRRLTRDRAQGRTAGLTRIRASRSRCPTDVRDRRGRSSLIDLPQRAGESIRRPVAFALKTSLTRRVRAAARIDADSDSRRASALARRCCRGISARIVDFVVVDDRGRRRRRASSCGERCPAPSSLRSAAATAIRRAAWPWRMPRRRRGRAADCRVRRLGAARGLVPSDRVTCVRGSRAPAYLNPHTLDRVAARRVRRTTVPVTPPAPASSACASPPATSSSGCRPNGEDRSPRASGRRRPFADRRGNHRAPPGRRGAAVGRGQERSSRRAR